MKSLYWWLDDPFCMNNKNTWSKYTKSSTRLGTLACFHLGLSPTPPTHKPISSHKSSEAHKAVLEARQHMLKYSKMSVWLVIWLLNWSTETGPWQQHFSIILLKDFWWKSWFRPCSVKSIKNRLLKKGFSTWQYWYMVVD